MKKAIIIAAAGMLALSCGGNGMTGDAMGTFDAAEVIVSGEVPGRIVEFNVSEGDVLEKGQVAGLIDTLQLTLQKRQLLSNIAAIKSSRPDMDSQLAPIREQLAKSRQEHRRMQNLLRADAATEKQLDDIASAIAVLEKQLTAQETALANNMAGIDAQVEALQVQVEQLDDQLARCRITSPIAGTVLAKYAQAGELAAQGSPLMKVADMNDVHLKAYLTAEQLSQVALGQQVKVAADFGNDNLRYYDGRVTWISPRSEFIPKNVVTANDRANMVYAVKVGVPNDGFIKLGMYGQVVF